jgi:hypothetical protein
MDLVNLQSELEVSANTIKRLEKEREEIVFNVVSTIYEVSNGLMDRGLWRDAKEILIALYPIWSCASTLQINTLSPEQTRMDKMIKRVLVEDPNMYILTARLGMLYMVINGARSFGLL